MGIRTVSCLRKADWTTDVLSLWKNVLGKVVYRCVKGYRWWTQKLSISASDAVVFLTGEKMGSDEEQDLDDLLATLEGGSEVKGCYQGVDDVCIYTFCSVCVRVCLVAGWWGVIIATTLNMLWIFAHTLTLMHTDTHAHPCIHTHTHTLIFMHAQTHSHRQVITNKVKIKCAMWFCVQKKRRKRLRDAAKHADEESEPPMKYRGMSFAMT